jgi:hypothetical protein
VEIPGLADELVQADELPGLMLLVPATVVAGCGGRRHCRGAGRRTSTSRARPGGPQAPLPRKTLASNIVRDAADDAAVALKLSVAAASDSRAMELVAAAAKWSARRGKRRPCSPCSPAYGRSQALGHRGAQPYAGALA